MHQLGRGSGVQSQLIAQGDLCSLHADSFAALETADAELISR